MGRLRPLPHIRLHTPPTEETTQPSRQTKDERQRPDKHPEQPQHPLGWERAHIVAEHIVEPRDGGSYVTLTLVTTGIGAAIVSPILDPFSRRNVKAEALGLKRLCESSAKPAEAPL